MSLPTNLPTTGSSVTHTCSTSTSGMNFTCHHCGKQANGGTFISGVFYCPYCASEINKNNAMKVIDKVIDPLPNYSSVPVPCRVCSNHPSNGGSGVCWCTLGSITTYV